MVKAFFICCSVIFLSGCYVLRNAHHFTELYRSRQPISAVLEDENTSEESKEKLRLVQDILQLAQDEDLNASDSYKDFIDLGDRLAVSYLVQAAEVDQLKLVTWWFPVVGSVPYLGYFQETERDQKLTQLKDKGYDVLASEVDAFSGLGWFADPIFSTFLRKRTSSLANLLFHELTHATLWVSGNADFNENLASYVADVLTIQYLERRSFSEELVYYKGRKADYDLFFVWLSELRSQLETLYESRANMPLAQLLEKKKEIFSRFLNEKRPQFHTIDFIGTEPWNNATVLAVNLYAPETERFLKAHACAKTLTKGTPTMGALLRRVEMALEEFENPFDALDSLCVTRS